MNYPQRTLSWWSTSALRRLALTGLTLAALLCMSGCDQSGTGNSSSSSSSSVRTPTVDRDTGFVVCATGEGKLVSDEIAQLGKEKGINASVRVFSGTFDVLNAVKNPESSECNAIIVSASSWLDINVPAGTLKDRVSLMTTQIVVGLTDAAINKANLSSANKPHAEGENVISPVELMKLITSGKLKLAVPATTSNAGVSFLLLATSAFAGEPDTLTREQVEDSAIVSRNKEVMSKVVVRGGSSELKGWLLANPAEADGMVNYAGVIAQYNSEVPNNPGASLLHVYYLSPTYQADVPIAYVVRRNDRPEMYQFYRDLLVRLGSADVQRSFYRGGYHPASLELADEVAPTDVFKPEWGFDPAVEENLSYFLIPDNSQLVVFVRNSYEAYRGAVFVGLVVDFSGSMGEPMGSRDSTPRYERLYEALEFLLSDERMAEVGLPYRNGPAGDLVALVPFSTEVIEMSVPSLARSPEGRAQIMGWVKKTTPGGKTALYWGVRDALRAYEKEADTAEKRAAISCTIVLLTDGDANRGSLADMTNGVNPSTKDHCVVYAIGIGEANPAQLREVVRFFEGQVVPYKGEDVLSGVMRRAFGATR